MLKSYISIITNVSGTQIHNKEDRFVIEGAPITVDDAVMNGIRYRAEDNEEGMQTLVDKVVTLSHPSDQQGNNLDAYTGEALQKFYAGGHVTNTYRMDGVWYADIDINKQRLMAAENGSEFYERLEKKMNIGLSTGLYTIVDGESGEVNGSAYRGSATMQKYNHLAMLGMNEKPAGGDATVMRFNGEEVEHQVLNFNQMELQAHSTGLDFTGGHRAKMKMFEQSLKDSLIAKTGEGANELWIEDWNDDTAIYWYDGETYAIMYDASGDSVQLSGEPVRVTMKPSYAAVAPPQKESGDEDGNVKSAFKSLMELLGLASNRKATDNSKCNTKLTQNKDEGMSMSHRDIIAAKLGINADQLDTLSDAELTEKLDALSAPQEPQVNTVDVEAIKREATEAATAVVNAQRKSDLVEKLAANGKIGLSAETLGKLDVNELQALADKHSETAGVSGAFNGVAPAQFAELPE